jgi:hypothetical protein
LTSQEVFNSYSRLKASFCVYESYLDSVQRWRLAAIESATYIPSKAQMVIPEVTPILARSINWRLPVLAAKREVSI